MNGRLKMASKEVVVVKIVRLQVSVSKPVDG